MFTSVLFFEFLIIGLLFLFIAYRFQLIDFRRIFSSNKFWQGKEYTLFDVRELLIKGRKEQAIKTYQKIFHVGYSEAENAVDQLQNNIEEKNL